MMAHPVQRHPARRAAATFGVLLVAALVLTAGVGLVNAAPGGGGTPGASAPGTRLADRAAQAVVDALAVASEAPVPAVDASSLSAELADANGAAMATVTAAAGTSPAPASPATPTPTSAAVVMAAAYVRPATKDGPVPANLQPTIAAAPKDFPAPYYDGCHVPMDGARPSWACVYGKTSSKTTVVLFGDSHALSWFPAVLKLANDKGWRLLSLTMSACSPADIPEWIPAASSVSAPCTDWRTWAIGRIAKEKPTVALVTGTRGFATVGTDGSVLAGDARIRVWEAGMERTLDSVGRYAGRVIYLSDTPASQLNPPQCLAQNPMAVLACSTPVAKAISTNWMTEERHVAITENAGFIDTTVWVCPSTPCPVTVGNLLIYRDGGHMTSTFVASIGAKLEAAVGADLARHPPRSKTP
jgi:hypothetical protein